MITLAKVLEFEIGISNSKTKFGKKGGNSQARACNFLVSNQEITDPKKYSLIDVKSTCMSPIQPTGVSNEYSVLDSDHQIH